MGNLGSVIDELFGHDSFALSGPALGAEISEDRRQVNRLDGLYLRDLAVLDRSGAALADYGSTQAWVRTELRYSPSRASRDVHLARDLADALPVTRAALEAGDISIDHAQVIASVRGLIPDEVMVKVEPHLVDAATWKNPTQLRKVVAHVIHSYAPDKQIRDEQEDYEARRLHASVTVGGMGVGNFTLHPAGMETFMTALHALSRPSTNDDRTPAQRRADGLILMATLAMNHGELPTVGGVKPHVTVIAELDTITSTPGAPGADYTFGATTSGEWARRFTCDASVARVVFGPAGEILDAGRAIRTFTPAQLRAIIARDRTCIWAGCGNPPAWCDGHHITHWGHGGPTSVTNGALLCPHHHDRVHLYGHQIITDTGGAYKVNPKPGSDPTWKGHPPHRRQ